MRSDSEYQFASDEKNLRSGAEVYLRGYKTVLARYVKGQKILKANYLGLISAKKERNSLFNSALASRVVKMINVICFFGRNDKKITCLRFSDLGRNSKQSQFWAFQRNQNIIHFAKVSLGTYGEFRFLG